MEQIRRTLATERVGFQTYLFGEVGSTNTVLRRLAETGAPDGTVVLAEMQTMGRGRLGKPWFSPPGLNLYASVLFRPMIPPTMVPVFAFIASLALTDAIWAERVPASIKWPNDVLVEGRKVAGTLAAYASAGDVVEYVILGIGVNLNVDRATLVTALGPVSALATSLREAAGRRIDRNAFAAAFLNMLEKWDNEYRTRGGDVVLAAWRDRDALAGHLVEIRGGDPCRGRAIGVNRDGRLVVEEPTGARREILTGEIVIVD
jgi:BirA family transcriptional regulator, biotin operon repressor / biotin---[acetyl-CoA-carboxylase] ligase